MNNVICTCTSIWISIYVHLQLLRLNGQKFTRAKICGRFTAYNLLSSVVLTVRTKHSDR